MKDEALCSKMSMYVNAVGWFLVCVVFPGVGVFWMFFAAYRVILLPPGPIGYIALFLTIVVIVLIVVFLGVFFRNVFRVWKSVMDGTATRRKMGAVHENWKCFFLSPRFTEAYQARMVVLDEEERRREHGFALTQALTAVQEAREDVRTYFAGVADAFARFKSVDEAVQALECAGSDVRWYANLTRLCERWITCEEAIIKNLEAAQELIPLVSMCEDTQALIVFKENFTMNPTLPFPDPDDLVVSISQAHTRLKELGAIDVAQITTVEVHLHTLLNLLKIYGFPLENLHKS